MDSVQVRNFILQHNDNYYIHWTIVVIVYLITILFALCDCKEKFSSGGYNAPYMIEGLTSKIESYTDQKGNKWHHQFYPNAESLGGDLYHRPDLAGNIEELKKVCRNDPQCRGFNTDGWFKKTISSQDQWVKRSNRSFKQSSGPNRGLYIRLPGVRRNSPYPSILFPGTHMVG